MNENILLKKKEKKLIFFNEAIEYFDKFDNFDNFLNQDIQKYHENSLASICYPTDQLRDQMLDELNTLKELIADNPDLKLNALSEKEKRCFFDFARFFLKCPICGNQNHYNNLKRFYFNEDKQKIREKLVNFMNFKPRKFKNYNVICGIPCCNCFKELNFQGKK